MGESRHFIALDSDILRSLADLDQLLQEKPTYKTSDSKDFLIRDNGRYLKSLLKMVKNEELCIFVGSTIFSEVKHRENCIDFIKKYCYLPKMNATNFAEMVLKADDLAYKYCTENYKVDDKEYYPPMEKHYNAYLKREVPSNDAYAMVEATIANCLFITNNGQDFIFRKYLKDDKNSRVKGIVDINIKEGYMELDEQSGYNIVPKPMEFNVFIPLLKKGINNVYLPMADEDNFDKGADLI